MMRREVPPIKRRRKALSPFASCSSEDLVAASNRLTFQEVEQHH